MFQFVMSGSSEAMDSALLWSPVLVSSISLFTAVYGLCYGTLFRRWKGIKRHEAASCCISLLHGTTITALATYNVLTSPWDLAAPNTTLQDKLLEFSTAYFLVDLMHYLLFVPNDYLFVLHHVATSTYMISCRYFVGHGALSAMAMVALGEATSPLQNVWTLCRMGREDSPRMKRIYEAMSPLFTVVFTLFRVVLGPVLVYKISVFYFGGGGDPVIPRALAYTWMGKSALALVGSLVWVQKLWSGLFRFYKGKSKARRAEGELEGTERRRKARRSVEESEWKKMVLNHGVGGTKGD